MPVRAYYHAAIEEFLADDPQRILGVLTEAHQHALEEPQRHAWLEQVTILKAAFAGQVHARIFLEFQIPRMGKRADAVLVRENIVFVLEFKVGATEHERGALVQVEDYALDLKNFHEGSHSVSVVPMLISTRSASAAMPELVFSSDHVALPVTTNAADLRSGIDRICALHTFPHLDVAEWMAHGYRPTPTIIEAAQTLYRTHRVTEIARSDAGAKNLRETSVSVGRVIDGARESKTKALCFVTGVPGSGKTLAGLNIAAVRSELHAEEHAVFLSGNGPLVDVLREALARDMREREGVAKSSAERQVRSFIQNIHHFRDHYVGNDEVPVERVVVFDEAQRAWTREQASAFMQRKRGQTNFDMSEPEFLVSVMDRHADWCAIVCLIGGGQEINTGEAGISGWIDALEIRYPEWQVFVSPRIVLPEYGSAARVEAFLDSPRVYTEEHLHLGVSLRSFRAEALSALVGQVLDGELEAARSTYREVEGAYPIRVTRDLSAARAWLRRRARGSERFGLVASSGALRLRPEGIHIKAAIDPANWFLNASTDVRSSYYLEEVASEFDVQGLELDWVGVCWDGDLSFEQGEWCYRGFKGSRWHNVRDVARRLYLKNAYRVILTRARQGMVIFVPRGDAKDATRTPCFYDGTFAFLRACGLPVLSDEEG